MSEEWDDLEGISVTSDLAEIRRFGQLLLPAGGVIEMRALHAPRAGTVSGYFDHIEPLAESCEEWSGVAEGVYLTLNLVRRDLMARASNRAKEWSRHTSSDSDIVRRRWIPLDFDPPRPAGISSTDSEHEAAIKRATDCKQWLRSRGFPEASLILGDSGNGSHLLLRADLPNDEPSRQIVELCIEAAHMYFSDDAVQVDGSTANAARIWKVYGTLSMKGDDTDDRPHRLARLLEVPATVRPMNTDLLHELAAIVPTPPPVPARPGFRPRPGSSSFDLPAWIEEHQLPVVQVKPWKGGRLWVLNPCPWNPAHGNRAAWLIQFASGAIAAGCRHVSCAGRDWHALRDLFEPGWQERRGRQPELPDGLPSAIAHQFLRSKKGKS